MSKRGKNVSKIVKKIITIKNGCRVANFTSFLKEESNHRN